MSDNRQPLRIDPDRLWNEITATAQIGGTSKGGICRLTLTESDRQIRDWFVSRARDLTCDVHFDDMGNLFARRAGKNNLPPIAIGSHLDTQPTGGKFDGVLGVLAGLEVLQTLHDHKCETFAPIEVISFTNEEGSRFAPVMMASGVFAGAFSRDWACSQADREGIQFGDALEQIGYRGEERCGAHPLSAYFELHIEQGPVLEAERKDIGVVCGVQGVRWYDVSFEGQEAHTGTTPMSNRRNALLGIARMIDAVDKIAKRHAPLAVGTVGQVDVKPNSRNVIPGSAFCSVDFRHPDDSVLAAMEGELHEALHDVLSALPISGTVDRILAKAPVIFDEACIEVIREASIQSGLSNQDMISGAGHDAAYVASVAPTAMIFVPCKDGISHNEAEFSSKEQCGNGAQVLLQAVLEYDRRLAANGNEGH